MARKKTTRRKIFKLLGWLTLLILLLAAAGTTLWGFYLARQVETRFEGRRWSIPSRVYSDITLLFPGQGINPPAFAQKLRRLGYRKVTHPPEQARRDAQWQRLC